MLLMCDRRNLTNTSEFQFEILNWETMFDLLGDHVPTLGSVSHMEGQCWENRVTL